MSDPANARDGANPGRKPGQAVAIYSKYLFGWKLAATFWLNVWWLLSAGGILASALVAANPAFLKDGDFAPYGALVPWFALMATVLTSFLRPWRFHRAYQRAVYELRSALDKAILDPAQEARLPEIMDKCHTLILAAGSELDATDGIGGAPQRGNPQPQPQAQPAPAQPAPAQPALAQPAPAQPAPAQPHSPAHD